MGVMRFLIPRGGRELSTAGMTLTGFDGRVLPARFLLEGQLLQVRRDSSESGRLNLPWPVPGHGTPVLCTSALRERLEPYHLPVELARGRLGLLRDQLAAWQLAGMAVPDSAQHRLRQAQTEFCQAACGQAEPLSATRNAEQSLANSVAASDELTEAYVRQRLTVRRRKVAHLPVLMTCPLGCPPQTEQSGKVFASAFTGASLCMDWKTVVPRQGEEDWSPSDAQLDWIEAHRLIPLGGALLDFGPDGLPDWVAPFAGDYAALQSVISDYVETAISRYIGRVRTWEIICRANTGGALGLDEEHRLALAARVTEVARQIDDDLRLSIHIAQPWGEYASRGGHRLTPIQFIDALVRSGVGLNGVILEFAVGYHPEGSILRDRFELSRLLDLWSTLGLNLSVRLTMPTQSRTDPLADPRMAITPPQWRSAWSDAAQAEWALETIPLLLSKPAVTGIEWSHLSDEVSHRFPHGGLIRLDGTVKPALERLLRFRQSYWPIKEPR